MFEWTTVHSQSRVSLPADSAGGGKLLVADRREYYFCFYCFAYTPVSSRWFALGRLEHK
jgi:hypothetical protein